MPYCPKCGVEVDFKIKTCPLCAFEIPEVPHEHDYPNEEIELKNYYEELKVLKKKSRKRSRQILFIVILLVTIAAAVNNTMQDWLRNNELTFSPYVLSSIGLFIIYLLPVFGFIKDWKKILTLLFIGSTAFLFSIDFYADGLEWFVPVGLPLTVLSIGMLFLIMLIIKKKKPGRLYSGSIILGAASVLLIILETVIDHYLGEFKLEWSLQALVAMGSLSLLLILGRVLINRDAFAKLRRYMHL